MKIIIFIMEIREKLKKKKAEKVALQLVEQIKSIKFVEFISADTLINAQNISNTFYKIESKPNSAISNSLDTSIITNWLIENLSSFGSMCNTQFTFTIGDIDEPVWIKVHTNNVKEALIELWNSSISKEFVLPFV